MQIIKEYMVPACSGMRIDVEQGKSVTVIDVEGGQMVDFFAEVSGHPDESLLPGVTIDCNGSLKLKTGDTIYTNMYRPMMEVLSDDVGEHDLLHPCCQPEMYEFFYQNGKGHPKCFDNIDHALQEQRRIIAPINFAYLLPYDRQHDRQHSFRML